MPIDIPEQVKDAHLGWSWQVVYSPYVFSTWRLTSPGGDERFVKIGPLSAYPNIDEEVARMRWLAGRVPVPAVVATGHSGDNAWMVTEALPGVDATHPSLIAQPESTVRVLADGLRAFHSIPADGCPFDFRLDAALAHCRRRVEAGTEGWDDLHEEHKHMTPLQALEVLENTRPDTEDVVVCHGDYCFPNVMIQDGRAMGFLDLGEVGLADRWLDLAVGTWTCDWNVGPGYQELFLETYGIEPDSERIAFYRLMYDLAS